MPIIISTVGGPTWASLAVAQAIGSVFAVIVAFGWGVTGPGMIASAGEQFRHNMYADSIKVRLVLFGILAPVAVVVISSVAIREEAASSIYGLSMLVAALGGAWYFVGEKKPGRLILLETLPRVFGVLIGTLILALGGSLLWFVLAQIVGAGVAASCSAAVILRSSAKPSAVRAKRFFPWYSLRDQISGVVTASTAAVYVNAPLIFVTMVVPGSAPMYAVADKLMRLALAAYGPVTQVAQGAVGSEDRMLLRQRTIRAIRISIPLALSLGTGFAMLLPLGVALMSAGTVVTGFGLSAPLGIAFACIALSQVTGLACLVALGRSRVVAMSTVMGALVGLPLLIVGGTWLNVDGIAWAVATSEGIVVTLQLVVLSRILRLSRRIDDR